MTKEKLWEIVKIVFTAVIRPGSERQFFVSVNLDATLNDAFIYEKISAPRKP